MTPPTDAPTPTLDQLHTPGALSTQRLRNVLRLNGATSMLGGLIAAVAPQTLDGLLGTGHPAWVRLVGLGLSLYALELLVLAGGRARTLARWTPAVVVADAAWVAATGVGIVAGWFSFPGAITMALVGGTVGAFALRQHRQHQAMGLPVTPDISPALEIASITASVPSSAAAVWSVITDHELYGALAPNLGSVHATAPDGSGLTRTCTNRRGHPWHETCTLWNEGERFEVQVDTAGYPYPLQTVRGAWWMSPVTATETRVGMQFAFRPDASLQGRVFVAVMQAAFPLVLRRIIRGWTNAAADVDGAR
jgi:hypothetical protein